MISLSRLALFAAVLAACAHAESLDEIFKRMDKAEPEFQAFSANAKLTEYTDILSNTKETNLLIRLRRTNQGVFGIVRFLGEDAHTIHFKGKSVEIYFPNADQLDIYNDLAKYSNLMKQVLLLGFATSGKDIKKDYVVRDGGMQTVASKRTTRIELTPKDAEFKKLAAKIELWIPEGESNPIQEKATEPSGDTRTFLYNDLKLLKLPLKDSDFDFEPDQKPGAKTHLIHMK